MKIEANRENDFIVISMSGSLDSITSPEVAGFIPDELGDCVRVILDLAGLEYISSAGLRIMLGLAKDIGAKEGKLLLCGVSPQVDEVFKISGFAPLFKVHPNLAAAKRAMKG